VQTFFVSAEKLAKQAYRYDFRYRVAASTLIVAILLQVPLAFLFFYESRVRVQEGNRQGVALQTRTQLTGNLAGLRETATQLGQIKLWEPILRSRMPISAVLGAVEQTIPANIALSRIAVEAANYRAVLLDSGTFRVPENYTIALDGALKGDNSRAWEEFVDQLVRRLPPGSRVISCIADAEKVSKTFPIACKATLQAQANGYYFPLGVTKIDAEGNL
jgi:hypothetical protein